jgi:hypothetical protein
MNTSKKQNKTTVSKETFECASCDERVSKRNDLARGLCRRCFSKVPCGNSFFGCTNTLGSSSKGPVEPSREGFNKNGVNARCAECVEKRVFLSWFLILYNFYKWLLSGFVANYNDAVERYQPDIDAIEDEYQRRLSELEKEAADERAEVLRPLREFVENHQSWQGTCYEDHELAAKKTRLENASNRIDKKYSKKRREEEDLRNVQLKEIEQLLEPSKSDLRRSRKNFEIFQALLERQHEHTTECLFLKGSKKVDPHDKEHLKVFGKVDRDGHFHYEGFRCICQESSGSSESSELRGEDAPVEISEEDWNREFPTLTTNLPKKQEKKM